MASIFVDANIFIDLVEKRGKLTPDALNEQDLFISPLSIHILHYIAKQKAPYKRLLDMISLFTQVPFDQELYDKALHGPTTDFEDNVQLHSAAQTECDIFLTQEKDLLTMKFFGKTKIQNTITY